MAMQFYHTRDPIENLRVMVTVRKIAAGDERDRNTSVGSTWSYSFGWQEKKWSHRGAENRANWKKKKKTKPDESGGGNAPLSAELDTPSDHGGAALCSFVDADNYEPRLRHDSAILKTSGQRTSSLSVPKMHEGVSHTSAIELLDKNKLLEPSIIAQVAKRVHREESCRQMHLVLRLGDSNGGNVEDMVLASLRYYPHTGLLLVTPGFSTGEVDANDASGKDPKLTTFRITSTSTGGHFEYALDNENDLWPAVSADDHAMLRELRRLDQRDERSRLEEWSNKHGTFHARELEQSMNERDDNSREQVILMEVVSVTGVNSCDPVRVSIELQPASGWNLIHGTLKSKTLLSKPATTGPTQSFATFGFQMQWVIKRPLAECETSAPTFLLSVVSRDRWGRERLVGKAEVSVSATSGFADVEVNLWRNLMTSNAQLEEFFLGSDFVRMESTPTINLSETTTKIPTLSRLGSRTSTSGGSIRLRLNVFESSNRASGQLRPSTAGAEERTVAKSVMKRSVEDILRSVKTYQHSSTVDTRPTILPASLATDRSLQAILARLKGTATSSSAS